MGQDRRRWLGACERGNAALVGAATLPLLLTAGALSYDAIQLGLWSSDLQATADRGARAGAMAAAQGGSVAQAVDRATRARRDFVIVAAPTEQRADGAVRVSLVSQRRLVFLGALLDAPPERRASATAVMRGGRVTVIAR